ncbi:branched-chain amino acid ABC transporter permease [Rhodococcus sp. 14C212]|uniref:branched-chain amino acid ABC transporter permease n=1 Tax=Rhodococcus sp. 14C212 TaxID=2711209 RepID=UPI0013ED9AED|nr:branched-chain amino acid ABC transporter permease [Rhodococcus sp. 14C212]NGP08677.1 branched-chain amino acid ABC transporter permease [Rhodococcus sp. 14C212]
MEQVIVALFEGLTLGGTYALVGLGLVLAFRATNTLSFAHGQLIMLAVFIIGRLQASTDLSFGFQLIFVLVVVSAVCMLFYQFVLRRLDGLPHLLGFVATLGLASIIDGFVSIYFGAAQFKLAIPGLPDGSVTIGGANISTAHIVVAVIALVVVAAFATAVHTTSIGTRLRAAGQDTVLAAQSGIRVRRIYLASWAMTGVCAVAAGLAFGSTHLVTHGVIEIMLAAFPAIFLGGLDSLWGALVGGVTIGLLQGFTMSFVGTDAVNIITWVALLGVMIFLPNGIFGTKDTVRV